MAKTPNIGEEFKESWNYYNEILREYVKTFFESNKDISPYIHLDKEGIVKHDYVQIINLLDLKNESFKLLNEVVDSKPEYKILKKMRPEFFEREKIAQEFASFIKTQYPEKFKQYKELYFSDWQLSWTSSLANLHIELYHLDIRKYGRSGLFLSGSYLSTFELFFQLILRPFAIAQGELSKIEYRMSREIFIKSLNGLHGDNQTKARIENMLEDLFDQKFRNSLAKYCIYIPIGESKIVYFKPDKIAKNKHKKIGEIEIESFVPKLILLQSIFWVSTIGCCKNNPHLKECLKSIYPLYNKLRPILISIIGSIEIVEALEGQLLDLGTIFTEYTEVQGSEVGYHILEYQLWELWISFRLILSVNLKPDLFSLNQDIFIFPPVEKHVLHISMHKNLYIESYEEIMQSIVHPFACFIQKDIAKHKALSELEKLENGRFKLLFQDLNQDFRDSLAHNSYYIEKETQKYKFYKFGTLVRETFTPLNLEIYLNYKNIVDSLFPELVQMPHIIAKAQLTNKALAPSFNFPLSQLEISEKFALRYNLPFFAGIFCIKQAYHHLKTGETKKATESIQKIFKLTELSQILSFHEKECLLSFSLKFNTDKHYLRCAIMIAESIEKEAYQNKQKEAIYKTKVILLYLYTEIGKKKHKQKVKNYNN